MSTAEWLTIAQVAEIHGTSEDYARQLMSKAGIRAERLYPGDRARAVEMPGKGARTDLSPAIITDSTSWGLFGRHSRITDDVLEYLDTSGDADNYDVPALVDAYRAAINAVLDGTGITVTANGGDLAVPVSRPDDWHDLVRDAIASVDLADLLPDHARD